MSKEGSSSAHPATPAAGHGKPGRIERMLTTCRGNASVPPPNWEPLPHDAVFDSDGLPRPDVIKEHFSREGLLSEADVLEIIIRAALIWKEEPNVMRLNDPVVICGDIHGQFYDLLELLKMGGDPSTQKYVFLGDYVDRGCFGLEVILLLMSYKICYPKTMVMLRGNHESRHLTTYFNFKREVQYKYNMSIYNAMMSAFDCLPLTCILNNRFFCVHGGLSPEITSISDIDAIHRFREPPSSGPMCDLLWSDPMDEKETDPASTQLFVPNTTRGCSYVYSHAAACKFLETNSLITIIRGHEAQDEGYHLYKKTSKGFPAVICIFSAPNYCDTYDNRAAVVVLNKSVMNIRQYNSSPHPYYLPNFMNAFTWSLPFVAEKLLEVWSNIVQVVDLKEDTVTVPLEGTAHPSEVLEARGDAIRQKVDNMGSMSRMLRSMCEERDNMVGLNGLAGTAVSPNALAALRGERGATVRGFQKSQQAEKELGLMRRPTMPVSEEDATAPNPVADALARSPPPSLQACGSSASAEARRAHE